MPLSQIILKTIKNHLNQNKIYFVIILFAGIIPAVHALSIVNSTTTSINAAGSIQQQQDQPSSSFLDSIFNNNFYTTVLSAVVLSIGGYFIAKLRGLLKTLDSIKKISQIQLLQKEQYTDLQKEVNQKLDGLGKKIDENKKETDERLDKIQTDQYKIKDETNNTIIRYMFGRRHSSNNDEEDN